MTKEKLAEQLDGKSYREEISADLIATAKENGLVIVYGASDDLMEIEGAIEDEGGSYHGEEFLIDVNGLLEDKDAHDYGEMDDDEIAEWLKRKKKAKKIDAVWGAENEPAWTFKTTIPHATFNVVEGDGSTEVQCRGIVFNISDL